MPPPISQQEEFMSLPEIVTQSEWLSARKALLAREKEMTRALDALNVERRNLPMVRIDKPYRFEGEHGAVSLADMFEGRRQLIVFHFMFAPDWEKGCKGCSSNAEEMSAGLVRHLQARDTTLVYVSRAPIAKLLRYRAERGWTIPWYSSFGTDFNYDYQATVDPRRGQTTYNYRTIDEHRDAGTGYYFAEDSKTSELSGRSVFLRDGDTAYHTYSHDGRGGEMTGGAYYWLDLTPLGRQEAWEEPKGRVDFPKPAQPFFEN
jgi:predicted dithiol-disulfide oxidoreductase (DUF899 family)